MLVEAIKADSISVLLACDWSIMSSKPTSPPLRLRILAMPIVMFSNITIELSTTIPTPRANPPKLNRFREKPKIPIQMTAARVARGIAREIISVWRNDPRNKNTAIAAKPEPIIPDQATLATEALISLDSSRVAVSSASLGIKPFS